MKVYVTTIYSKVELFIVTISEQFCQGKILPNQVGLYWGKINSRI